MLQLERLLRHSVWADTRLLAALGRAPSPAPEALRELAHVRGAQEVWLARIEARSPRLQTWPVLTQGELERAGRELDEGLADLITRTSDADLERQIRYRTSAGTEFETPLSDVLLHVFMHSQYHRGKANAALRAAGAEPVLVDYVAWSRLEAPHD